jgi:uncharacterized protein (DUF885 family)
MMRNTRNAWVWTVILIPIFSLIGATARADSVSSIIENYEEMAAQLDGNSGPGWPDVRPEAALARLNAYRLLQSRLRALPLAPANSTEAETRELLDWRLDILIEGARFDEERIPFDNGDGFFNTANYAAATTVIRTEGDGAQWIARLERLPDYYNAQVANMRRGLRTGFTQPRMIAEGILEILRTAADQPVEASPLLSPFTRVSGSIPPTVARDLRSRAVRVIAERVKPAQVELVRFFETEYVPGARLTTGARSLPDGDAYYPYLIRRSTTLPLAPEEIEAVGRAEVERLTREMQEAMHATGWKGSLPDFIAELRSNSRFYAPDLQTYIEKGSEIGKRVDALLPLWFGTLPRLTWGIRRKPPETEASSSGYDLGDPVKGISGSVVVGSRSFHDPLFSLPSWILHEGVPGHHLQIALAQERSDLPPFRRKDDVTAFVEGWALYSEQLGEEMGVYRDPYERFGRLAFNIWRACRLVMDVGIHWHGQTPAEAERCLLDHTTLPQTSAHYETLRYTAWPAQALAYKIGELRFLALRQRAQTRLGARFDVREFHDRLLDDGPVPLGMLERRIDRWLDSAPH